MRARPKRLLLAATVVAAVALIGPTAAQAAPAGAIAHTPLAFLGIDIGDIVGDIIKKLVDWIVPDFASGWAISLVKWLVAVPNVSDARAYPHLNSFRSGLVGVGFALLSVTFTLACLHTATGTPEGGPAMRRTITAAAVLVFYPRIVGLVVLGTNLLTGSMITNHLVVDGTDKMLGAALTGAIVTNGIGASLLVAAATISAYFVAALMVLKIGLLALQAVFFLSGALVWGLYPLRSTAWLARAWSSAGLTLAVLPVAWAVIFSAAALLTSDSLVWSSHGALSDQLQQIAKPFAAVSCLWVAKAAPGFLLTAARSMGLNPMSVAGLRLPGGRGGGKASGQSSPAARPSAVQTNADRFRGLGLALGQRAAPVVAGLRARASGIRAAAAASVAPLAAGLPTPVKSGAAAAAKVGGVAARVASVPVKANRGYKRLAVQGAAARLNTGARQGQGSQAPAAAGANAAGGAGATQAPARTPGSPSSQGAPTGSAKPAAAAGGTPAGGSSGPSTTAATPTGTVPTRTPSTTKPAPMPTASPQGSTPGIRTPSSSAAGPSAPPAQLPGAASTAVAPPSGSPPPGPAGATAPPAPAGAPPRSSSPASKRPPAGSSPSTTPSGEDQSQPSATRKPL
jgi:hypothetical protein